MRFSVCAISVTRFAMYLHVGNGYLKNWKDATCINQWLSERQSANCARLHFARFLLDHYRDLFGSNECLHSHLPTTLAALEKEAHGSYESLSPAIILLFRLSSISGFLISWRSYPWRRRQRSIESRCIRQYFHWDREPRFERPHGYRQHFCQT